MGLDDDLRDLTHDRDMEQMREARSRLRRMVQEHIAWLRTLDISDAHRAVRARLPPQRVLLRDDVRERAACRVT